MATFTGTPGNDSLVGRGGGDDLYGGGGNDTLRGEGGADTIFGGTGDDSAFGGAQNDSILGEDGSDTLSGDAGNDTLIGGAGDDSLLGGDNTDSLSGGDGDDTIVGGAGADALFGGDGQDRFVGGGAGSTVDGGEGGIDSDTLDLTGLGPLRITYGGGDNESGTVTFYAGPGRTNPTGTLTFTNIENVVPCFTPGTLIATPKGLRRVEDIRPGDAVLTRDNGPQTVRWAGRRHVSRAEALARPSLAPVRIAPGVLHHGRPGRALVVSPQHRVLWADPRAELLFGAHEVLVPALHLVGRPGVVRLPPQAVTYCHLLFDRHEIVLSEGAWTESFQPGAQTLGALDDGPRDELRALFPDLAELAEGYVAARRSLRGFEARLLA